MDKKVKYEVENLNGYNGGLTFSVGASISLVVSLIFSFIISVISLSSGTTLEEFSTNTAVILISFLVGSVTCALTIVVGSTKFKFGLKSLFTVDKTKNNLIIYLATLLITFGVIFGLAEINVYFLNFLKDVGLSPSSPTLPKFSVLNFILVIIIVCVLPAVLEETLFRGIITSSLKDFGEVFAVVVSGALFSLFHMNPTQTLYQFIFGALFAFISIRAKSVLPVILAHFINNLFVVLNYYFWNLQFDSVTKIIITVVALISLAVGVLLILFFVKDSETTLKTSKKESKRGFIKGAMIGLIVCLAMWLTNLV